jgi:hypothetical protein
MLICPGPNRRFALLLQLADDELRERMLAAGLLPPNPSDGQDGAPTSVQSSNSSPSPMAAGQSRAPRRNQPTKPKPGAAAPSDPTRRATGGPHETLGAEALCADPDEQHPCDAADPVPSGGQNPSVGARHGRRADATLTACAGCGITAKMLHDCKLKECSRCRSVRYCGKACQVADWPVHKATCKRLQAAQG